MVIRLNSSDTKLSRAARTRAPDRERARPAQGLEDLGTLSLLVRSVEEQSFTRAARRAGTTTSAVSKRIAALEERLGVRLFERTTRQAVPTEAGRTLYEHACRVLEEVSVAEEAIAAHRGELSGRLRVSAPVTFGQMHIVPIILEFSKRNPTLRVALSLSDVSVDLVANGVDVAIRTGRVQDSSLLSRKLAGDWRVVCASPEYLAQHGAPRVPQDLLQHTCLRHPLMLPSAGWHFVTPQGPITLPVAGHIEIDHVGALRDAALGSHGIVLLPHYAVVNELKSHRLVSLLTEFMPPPAHFRALWPAGKQPLKRVTALVEFLATELPLRLQ